MVNKDFGIGRVIDMGHTNYRILIAALATIALGGCGTDGPLGYPTDFSQDQPPADSDDPHADTRHDPHPDGTTDPGDTTTTGDTEPEDIPIVPNDDYAWTGAPCDHVGQCANYSNSPAACIDGRCEYDCAEGFFDCDYEQVTGCEACGSCDGICTEPGSTTWGWAVGAGSVEDDFGMDVALDSDGNLFVTGSVSADADLGSGLTVAAGMDDIFFSSYDANGDLRWAHRWGGPHADVGNGVATDQDGYAYVTGAIDGAVDFSGTVLTALDSDAFLARTAPDGTVDWAISFPAAGQDAGAGLIVQGGQVILVGWFTGVINLGGDTLTGLGRDMFVASFDTAGNHNWSLSLGGLGTDTANRVAADAQGNLYIVGSFESDMEFGESTLFAPEGTIWANVLLSLSADGAPRWAQTLGGVNTVAGRWVSVAASPDGQVYATGGVQAATDTGAGTLAYDRGLVMAAYSNAGDHVWSKMVGNNEYGSWEGAAAALDLDGNVYFSGQVAAGAAIPVNFGGSDLKGSSGDAFLASYTPDGLHRWSRRLDAKKAQLATAAAVDSAGRVYMTGFSNGTMDVEAGAPLEPQGKFDMFLVQALQ